MGRDHLIFSPNSAIDIWGFGVEEQTWAFSVESGEGGGLNGNSLSWGRHALPGAKVMTPECGLSAPPSATTSVKAGTHRTGLVVWSLRSFFTFSLRVSGDRMIRRTRALLRSRSVFWSTKSSDGLLPSHGGDSLLRPLTPPSLHPPVAISTLPLGPHLQPCYPHSSQGPYKRPASRSEELMQSPQEMQELMQSPQDTRVFSLSPCACTEERPREDTAKTQLSAS